MEFYKIPYFIWRKSIEKICPNNGSRKNWKRHHQGVEKIELTFSAFNVLHIYSSSISYFKAYKNHYFSPYVYFNNPNYRRQEDYQVKGVGINNTYIFNDKFNLNYALSYSDSRYHSRPNPLPAGGDNIIRYVKLIEHTLKLELLPTGIEPMTFVL